MMFIHPPFLKKNDTVALVAPAKAINNDLIQHASDLLKERGYRVHLGKNSGGSHGYFSGTPDARLSDFQEALDNKEIRAIWCLRGGYGSLHIIDKLDWSAFSQQSKWIIGFSDITVFHHKVHQLGISSIHATMPLDLGHNTSEAIDSLFDTLEGRWKEVKLEGVAENIPGEAKGELIGGNLSVLYGLLGTDDRISYQNKILFIEDVGEAIYAIDRMFYALKKSGVLDDIKGLIVGGMTSMKDSEPPFGQTLNELIRGHLLNRQIPLAFNYPGGHLSDNRALVFGATTQMKVSALDHSLLVYQSL